MQQCETAAENLLPWLWWWVCANLLCSSSAECAWCSLLSLYKCITRGMRVKNAYSYLSKYVYFIDIIYIYYILIYKDQHAGFKITRWKGNCFLIRSQSKWQTISIYPLMARQWFFQPNFKPQTLAGSWFTNICCLGSFRPVTIPILLELCIPKIC